MESSEVVRCLEKVCWDSHVAENQYVRKIPMFITHSMEQAVTG
jgi:hypothetical protein